MNIHEYQAKELLAAHGVAVPAGSVAFSPEEAEKIATSLNTSTIVVKSQIHAGGRGKGTFRNGYKGGVKVVKTAKEAREVAQAMLGQVLVTNQTGPEGRKVQKVLIAAGTDIKRELYLAILLDRATSRPTIIASQAGGMDIEAVAAETPEKIIREVIDPAVGLMPYQSRKIALALGLSGSLMNQAVKLFAGVYKAFIECDCTLMEINPLVVTPDDKLSAIDAKLNFDDNALYRQPKITAMRDLDEEEPTEIEAGKYSLNYIKLDGNIACLVNGAGLAMATMDIIKYYGGEPANFLDVGGGASRENVTAAFRIILSDPNVKGILVNIFGGIMDCAVIADGVLAAVSETRLPCPLVVRLEGNNVETGKKKIQESGLAVINADSLADAAQKIVAAVNQK